MQPITCVNNGSPYIRMFQENWLKLRFLNSKKILFKGFILEIKWAFFIATAGEVHLRPKKYSDFSKSLFVPCLEELLSA